MLLQLVDPYRYERICESTVAVRISVNEPGDELDFEQSAIMQDRHTVYHEGTEQRMSHLTQESDAERKKVLQMIDDGLAESRVSIMYNEESMDEGKDLIDNLENNEEIKKDDEEEDEGAALIAQM